MNTSLNRAMTDLFNNIHNRIALLAFQKAERRGLNESGHEVEDWLEAEQQVLTFLRGQ